MVFAIPSLGSSRRRGAPGPRSSAASITGGNAKHVLKSLAPTELLIFGRPDASTPLMQIQRTAGLDLPLKALVWREADGAVWVTYNDIGYIALRHGVEGQRDAIGHVHEWFDGVIAAIRA